MVIFNFLSINVFANTTETEEKKSILEETNNEMQDIVVNEVENETIENENSINEENKDELIKTEEAILKEKSEEKNK